MATTITARTETPVPLPLRAVETHSGDSSPPSKRGHDVGHVPSLLGAEEERALAVRAKAGDRGARDALIEANLGLVLHIVRGSHCEGMTREDLRQEGMCGLIRAAELYDPCQHDVRFGAYAAVWIRRCVQRAAGENLSLIRLPRYLIGLHGRCQRAVSETRGDSSARAGRSPEGDGARPEETGRGDQGEGGWDLDELADRLQLSVRRLRSVVSAIKTQTGWSIAEEGSSVSLEETVVDPHQPELEEEKAEANAELRRAIRSLTRIEARIIRFRFGLDVVGPRSARRRPNLREAGPAPVMKFSEISRRLGISAARVRTILQGALEKMRAEMDVTRDQDDPLPGRRGAAA